MTWVTVRNYERFYPLREVRSEKFFKIINRVRCILTIRRFRILHPFLA